MIIRGILQKDKSTKDLAKKLNFGEIAVIDHRNIDEIAALSLKDTRIKAVINLDESISGKYPNKGPLILYESGIKIFECQDKSIFDIIENGETISIEDGELIYKEEVIGNCKELTKSKIDDLLKIGYDNIENELDDFIDNTLHYAKKEKELVTGNIEIPKVKTKFKNRHALVVVRGKDYKKDLLAVRNYISEVNPVFIGVDGGGDALLDAGYTPDIVIGDMDSVSDKCLKSSGEIVVHSYPNGKAPGLERVEKLGLESVLFPSPGTSEDIALLLAYSNDVDLIVAVGTHNSMIDFLEKGRKGMASTFLVRLKVGPKLIDAKGVNELYKSSLKPKYMIGLGLAALLPVIVIVLLFPPMQEILKLVQIKLRILLGF